MTTMKEGLLGDRYQVISSVCVCVCACACVIVLLINEPVLCYYSVAQSNLISRAGMVSICWLL